MRSGYTMAVCFAALAISCSSSDSGSEGAIPVPGASVGAGGSAAAPTASAPVASPGAPTQAPATQPSAAAPSVPGSGTQPPAGQAPGAGAPPAAQPPAGQPASADPTKPGGKPALAMDECGLKTQYPGDELCINPPPAEKGFQMHIGPSNYDNPEPEYVLQPGEEVTETFTEVSGNTKDIYYYWRQYRMRPGSHHLIINASGGGGGGLGVGRRVGGSSNMAKDNPEAGVIAPENEGVGMPLAANTMLSNSLHYFNITDKPIIKEVWVNFWYRDEADVTEPTNEVFSMLGMGIQPGERVQKHGQCEVTAPGRLLTIYGHVHAHNKRFSVWRTRGSDKKLIHEAYDWEHPHVSEFSSTVTNPMVGGGADGGFSGVVDLEVGDLVEFECDILNDTDAVFLGANEATDDEMCIMIGDSVGTTIPVGCTDTTAGGSSTGGFPGGGFPSGGL
jgi:hypothetical protein